MQAQNRHPIAQDDTSRAAEQPVRTGPQLLDLRDLERVAGGLPRGGWGASADSAVLVDAYQLPRGGW